MGRQMKEEGKRYETSMIIIMTENNKKNSPNLQLRHTDLFVEDQNTVMLSEYRDKTRN